MSSRLFRATSVRPPRPYASWKVTVSSKYAVSSKKKQGDVEKKVHLDSVLVAAGERSRYENQLMQLGGRVPPSSSTLFKDNFKDFGESDDKIATCRKVTF